MKPRVRFMPFTLLLLHIIAVPLFFIEQSIFPADFVVTSENDSGPGTLRQAILDVNSSGSGSEGNSITFDSDVTTIKLLMPLPLIENSVTIDGFSTIGITCDILSPTDNPEQFSLGISVTIDGSLIPTTGSTPLVGLAVCADNVTLRGLRIANFANTEDAQVAGIATAAHNTAVECCEITNLNGNDSGDSFTVVGIQGNIDTLVSQCFVHNLSSTNKQAINSDTKTGGVVAISLFKTVSSSRIEEILTGNIVSNATGSNMLTLTTGSAFGIINEQAFSLSCTPPTKECTFPIDCQGSDCILVNNCIVNCCQSGSVSATTSANVIIKAAIGINVNNSPQVLINESKLCNIYSGNATLLEETFSLDMLGASGITVSNSNTVFLYGNTVLEIHRGSVDLGGINSSATLKLAAGIVSVFNNSTTAENNSISCVTCQPVIASGACSTIQDTDFLNTQPSPICVNNLAFPSSSSGPICSGVLCLDTEAQLCNNMITSINAGKRNSTGEQSLITSGYSAGIWASCSQKITAENNTLQDIFGTELASAPGARGIFGGAGCKGIALWILSAIGPDLSITAERNRVERICEQSLRTATGIPGKYIFLENVSDNTKVLSPAAQTTGISIKAVPISSNVATITINKNTVNTIIGSHVTGNNAPIGTTAAGISIEPSSILSGSESCAELQEANTNSTVQDNAINDILGGTNNNAYGILLNGTVATLIYLENIPVSALPGLFDIQNNTITNIRGLGSPQSCDTPLISLEDCGSSNPKLITLVPFPYQPSSGIYALFGNCSTISGNNVTNVTELSGNARGITTQASSDLEISFNTISKIKGYGIFVGGATASIDFVNNNSGIFTEAEFEDIFASTRNKIFSNSTFDNTKQGIELGIIDWNSYFQVSEVQCEGAAPLAKSHQEILEDSITIVGNHGQVAPRIEKVSINRDIVTVDVLFKDSEHIFTNFIIQFFANSSNSVPHGEHPITDFNDQQFVMTTDINGTVVRRFSFIPTHLVNKADSISAHVTVAEQQPSFVNDQEKGDTSEFAQQQKSINPYPVACHTKPKPHSFMGQLCQ